MTITPVAFADPPLLNSVGVHEPFALRAIIEVATDAGLTGLGETYADEKHLAALHAAAAAIEGADVYHTEEIYRRVQAIAAPETTIASGLVGHSRGHRPGVLPLRGGLPGHPGQGGRAAGRRPARRRGQRGGAVLRLPVLQVGRRIPAPTPTTGARRSTRTGIVAQAKRMVDGYGFTALKLKGGVFPPAQEIEAIRALRDAFPDHPLRLDPNAAWTPETSIGVARELDGVLEYLEDPTPGIDGMARGGARRPRCRWPPTCASWPSPTCPPAIRENAVQVILSDHHYWGGLRRSKLLAGICETFGIGLSMHSNSHLGISLAAMVQLAAAVPNLTYACDTHWPWKTEDVVAGAAVHLQRRRAPRPRQPRARRGARPGRPGRLHEQYLACGLRNRDDTGYMQRHRTRLPSARSPAGKWRSSVIFCRGRPPRGAGTR